METWKTVLIITGIFVIIAGIIIFGFFPTVSQLMHDDEVEFFTATLVNVDQQSVYHRRGRNRSGYTTYVNTLTFKSNDDKHPANFIIVDETRSFNKYKLQIGNTFSVYNYSDRYAFTREDLFVTTGLKTAGLIAIVVGTSMVMAPITGARRRRFY